MDADHPKNRGLIPRRFTVVARIVAKRRGEHRLGDKKKATVSNATVNRTVVEPLRAILRRAEVVWGARVARIGWKRHKLREAQERVREASIEEEIQAINAMPEDYRPALRFALMTGCRRAEIVGLTWKDVNMIAREFRVTGKGDRSRTIPMTQEVFDLLSEQLEHKTPSVFSFAAQRARDGRSRGVRYPITMQGFETAWNRHVRPVLKDFRFHDTRHTAATRLMRATGKIKSVQILLGHADITTSSRYAHVTHNDLRQDLEAAARAATTTTNTTNTRNDGKRRLK